MPALGSAALAGDEESRGPHAHMLLMDIGGGGCGSQTGEATGHSGVPRDGWKLVDDHRGGRKVGSTSGKGRENERPRRCMRTPSGWP